MSMSGEKNSQDGFKLVQYKNKNIKIKQNIIVNNLESNTIQAETDRKSIIK